MKQLRYLKAQYDSSEISELVDFASKAPVLLPEDQKYQFRKEGRIVHVYGMTSGITDYNIGELAQGIVFQGARKTTQGIEVALLVGGVEQIILHSKPYNPRTANKTAQTGPQTQSAGQNYHPGSYHPTGESHGVGESHATANPSGFSGESRSQTQGNGLGESRATANPSGFSGESRSQTQGHGIGESRGKAWQGITGGESRGNNSSESRPSRASRTRSSNARGNGSSESRGGSHGGESR